jgi:hypothetical protein
MHHIYMEKMKDLLIWIFRINMLLILVCLIKVILEHGDVCKLMIREKNLNILLA